MMEFHISRAVRDRYRFAETLFSFNGNVVFASVSAARELAYRMNLVRDARNHPERAVNAGALYAMGLIDEASHAVIARYRKQYDPTVMTDALGFFASQVGEQEMDKLLLAFVQHFPGSTVYSGQHKPEEWLKGATDGVPHRAAAMEEMVLLWMANRNTAFHPFAELFEDSQLAAQTAYRKVALQLPTYFATRPLIPIEGAAPVNLYDLLRAPAEAAPGSLSEQLTLIRARWKTLLGTDIDRYLLIAGDILREEELAIWMQFHPADAASEAAARAEAARAAEEAARRRREQGLQQWPGITSHSNVPVFGDPAHEYERFSADQAWMPTAVLIAKSTYVWLAQLSRKYARQIDKLDQVPDEELDDLARRGMNSLWLIGIWERSRASKTIKQLCGNHDAVASAYSLFDYRIADDLGGEEAYIRLRDRCFHRGIRLASDMVPNHMGIDSPWVAEHPDWFISRQDKPYPAYDFSGPDLSADSRVEIRIERHYYDQIDAAVVFERRDRRTGDLRYVYHGNDGTSFPWNDTAQLDYLNPAVREQVIQTILHVARLFPVIRFDAAMTLAKRHFQRLWFPNPGSSGAIPSRAEYGMTTQQFSEIMPQEFWREVVDRVAAEVPGTLLLAEAFWLMEGYFVRTLGMHRVYNSAFMNMMRDEENAKYRSVIKNTIEFDPDILKRYVNFMSNPDERTAVDQFGTGDKCYGVAAVMSTLPGLPMFGHGQIEGFTEKYGMEYRWPRHQEDADRWLVERHERQIAPLLHKRYLFAESANFLLYDFFREDGAVDENVFAYSNRAGDERALVLYHNHYGHTRGTVDWSAAFADKGAGGQLRQRRLREGLLLNPDPSVVVAFRDGMSGLHHLRRSVQLAEHGLTVELHAYQCYVFTDWRELRATEDKPWDALCDHLGGRGVADLDEALVAFELQPVHRALAHLLEPSLVRQAAELSRTATGTAKQKELEILRGDFVEHTWSRCRPLLREAKNFLRGRLDGDPAMSNSAVELKESFCQRLHAVLGLPTVEAYFAKPWTAAARRVLPSQSPQLTATALWGPVLAWVALGTLSESLDPAAPASTALRAFDELRLRQPLGQALAALGFEGEEPWRVAARIKVALLVEAGIFAAAASAHDAAQADAKVELAVTKKVVKERAEEPVNPLLTSVTWQDPDVRWLTGTHEASGRSYFIQEGYEELLWWLQLPALCSMAQRSTLGNATLAELRSDASKIAATISDATAEAAHAGYCLEDLLPVVTSENELDPAFDATPDAEPVAPDALNSVDLKAKRPKS